MNDNELLDRVWKALVEHGSSRKSEEAVRRFWATLSPKQKETAANNIPRKVREGKYVQYNPIQAIKENIRSYQMPEPENLNRNPKYKQLEPTTPLVSASYNEAFGVYTLAEALEYGMYIKSGMNFDWETYKRETAINPNYQPVLKIRD